MEEKTIKSCWDTMTKKCYLILKQLYWKEFAIEAIQSAPFFNQTKNETKSTSLE
jgi:hypothetical protein